MTYPILDARPSLDPRNENYPIRPLLEKRDLTLARSYTWATVGPILNQNTGCYHCSHTGGCTGHAQIKEAMARPKVHTLADAQRQAWDLYHEAQRIDEWPGEDYEGSSVNAAAKAARARGLIRAWAWGQTPGTSRVAISRFGPGIGGIPWFTGMFDPDSAGRIRPTGEIEGWHAILHNSVNVTRKTMGLANSWGPDWGINGSAFMTWEDWDYLMSIRGAELLIPTLR